MVTLTFSVSFLASDADVEIEVSDRDAAVLKRFIQDNDFADIMDDEDLEPLVERLRRKIVKALAEQLDDGEDIDVDDLDFFFDCPEFEEDV